MREVIYDKGLTRKTNFLEDNSDVCRSYRGKTGREGGGVGLFPSFWVGLK